MVLLVKNTPASVGDIEMWVWSLGQEIPDLLLEEGMATHSSILAWKIPMDRGARWATVHSIAKNWTWLKQLILHGELSYELVEVSYDFNSFFPLYPCFKV